MWYLLSNKNISLHIPHSSYLASVAMLILVWFHLNEESVMFIIDL